LEYVAILKEIYSGGEASVCVDRSVFSYTVHQPKSAGKMAKGLRIWLALPTFTASAY
jgi:hypothetical protein